MERCVSSVARAAQWRAQPCASSLGARADCASRWALQIDHQLLSVSGAAKVRKLVAMGAPVDWQDENGRTPLHRACEHHWQGEFGQTIIYFPPMYHFMGVVKELVWSLCDLKILDNESKTAAEKAKENNFKDLAEYLANEAPREQVRRHDPFSWRGRGGQARVARRALVCAAIAHKSRDVSRVLTLLAPPAHPRRLKYELIRVTRRPYAKSIMRIVLEKCVSSAARVAPRERVGCLR